MLTQKQFIAALEEYPDLASDENWREYLEDSFDELKSFSPEDLSIFFALLDPALGEDVGEDFKEAITSNALSLEEGVELANKMYLLDNDDEKEAAFVEKLHMDDGLTFEGIYKDAEDFARQEIYSFVDFEACPGINSYINFKGYGEDALNSVDYATHEYHGRLFVFRR